MSMARMPDEHCLPPPVDAREEGTSATLVVVDGTRPVVWIRARSLGFGGFPDALVAAEAAWIARAAILRRAGAGCDGVPAPSRRPRLRLSDADDDGIRWVLADRLPVARLIDPHADGRAHDAAVVDAATDATCGVGAMAPPEVAFDIAMPRGVTGAAARAAAYRACRAVREAGLPWRLWNTVLHPRQFGISPPASHARDVVRESVAGPLAPRRGSHGAHPSSTE
jgi:hypothetical protein